MAFKSVRGNEIIQDLIKPGWNEFVNFYLADFAEHLKLIGYQENIPLAILSTFSGNETSFRAYANILIWLINCLDPDAMVHHDCHTESDRVMLIRTATEFLVNY